MKLVQVNSSRINNSIRYIKSIFSSNTHESAQIAPFGDDSVPLKNTKGIKASTDTDAIEVILGYFNRNNIAKEGEKRLFSVKNDGSEGFYIYFKNDGTLEVGGNSDNLVRFSELKSGFDQLKSDFNDFVQKYNTHTHPVSGSATLVTTNLTTATTASIDDSKIDEIKTI